MYINMQVVHAFEIMCKPAYANINMHAFEDTICTSAHMHTHPCLAGLHEGEKDKKTQPALPPLAPWMLVREDASHLPFPLFRRRPISIQPLTHLSRTANWAPVYSPQQRNRRRRRCWRRRDEGGLQHLGTIKPKEP